MPIKYNLKSECFKSFSIETNVANACIVHALFKNDTVYFFYYQVKNYVYWQHLAIEYCLASDSELTI